MPFTNVSPVVRKRMAHIRKKDTKPEITVRQLVHRMGYRYRLYRSDLPGTPDLVFPLLKKIVLVHGCFWHRYDCSLGKKQPMHRKEYWLPKLARNHERDAVNQAALRRLGFRVLVIWECQTRDRAALKQRLASFLES